MAACKEGTMLVMCSTTDLKLRPKGLSILTGYTLGGTGGKFRSPLPDLFHSLSEKGFHGSVRQSALHALYNNHSQHCRTCLACQRLGMWMETLHWRGAGVIIGMVIGLKHKLCASVKVSVDQL